MASSMSSLSLGVSTGSAGNRPAGETAEKSRAALKRATKNQRRDTEVKDPILEKRTLKRHNAELRLAHQFYQVLPGDGYDSYKTRTMESGIRPR